DPNIETTHLMVGAHPDRQMGGGAGIDRLGRAVVAEAPPVVAAVFAGVPVERDLERGGTRVRVLRRLGDHVRAGIAARIGPRGSAGECDFAGLTAVEELAAGPVGGTGVRSTGAGSTRGAASARCCATHAAAS